MKEVARKMMVKKEVLTFFEIFICVVLYANENKIKIDIIMRNNQSETTDEKFSLTINLICEE